MNILKFDWAKVLAYLLVAFFIVGSITNLISPDNITEQYARWGYPSWFHLITGSLELITALFLLSSRFRFWGAALGCTVMLAATATVVWHQEYAHAGAPILVFVLTAVLGYFNRPSSKR